MRLFAYITAGTVATLAGAWMAWSQTEESRLCARLVKEELAHYSPVREAERIKANIG